MAVEEGDLALISAPPRDRTPTQTRDRDQEWIRNYWSCRPHGARAMLEKSLAAFGAKYSNIQSLEWASAIESEISRDLSSMQRHPAIMVQHRRYVVLRSERTPRAASRDGVSCDILLPAHTDCICSWSGLRQPSLTSEMIFSQSKHR
jgi:hypothetical protein